MSATLVSRAVYFPTVERCSVTVDCECRKLADRCAAEGFYVVVPDLFRGDPFQPQDMKNRASLIPAWVAKHPPVCYKICLLDRGLPLDLRTICNE